MLVNSILLTRYIQSKLKFKMLSSGERYEEMDTIQYIINFIPNLLRRSILKKIVARMAACIDRDLMEDFLDLLLQMMRLLFLVDYCFRKNIKKFKARYTFKSRDGSIVASAIFAGGKMKIIEQELPETDITIIFKDGRALWEFLMSGNPDIFAFILDNKLSYRGNLNYVLKFGYLAKHMQLMFGL